MKCWSNSGVSGTSIQPTESIVVELYGWHMYYTDLCNDLFLSSGVSTDCHGVPGLHHQRLQGGREREREILADPP